MTFSSTLRVSSTVTGPPRPISRRLLAAQATQRPCLARGLHQGCEPLCPLLDELAAQVVSLEQAEESLAGSQLEQAEQGAGIVAVKRALHQDRHGTTTVLAAQQAHVEDVGHVPLGLLGA